jgi:hypothetical protein
MRDEYEVELDWLQEDLESRTFRSDSFPDAWPEGPSGLRRGGSSLGSFFRPLCDHPPQCVLKSEEGGWNVWAGRGLDCDRSFGKFHLLLNLTGDSVVRKHTIPVPELSQWEQRAAVPEILLDWPDMGAVSLPWQFWRDLVAHLSRAKAQMLVFCVGGHGRTGTAIACIMVACGWTSEDAIAWVRAHYCPQAIETRQQENYIRMIERKDPGHATDNTPQGTPRRRGNR